MSDLDDAITAHADGAVLAVVVAPRAGRTGMERIEAGAVRIRVAAAPVDGAANAALLRYLADLLDVPRGGVRLLAGATSRRKRVLVSGVSAAEVVACLASLLNAPVT